MAPAAVADEAVKLLAAGFPRGQAAAGLFDAGGRSRRRARGARAHTGERCGDGDYNQALTPEEALRRGRALDGEGVYWIEEPTRHDDYAGCAAIARELATPVQLGENFSQCTTWSAPSRRAPAIS
jgi:mandelate racemase